MNNPIAESIRISFENEFYTIAGEYIINKKSMVNKIKIISKNGRLVNRLPKKIRKLRNKQWLEWLLRK